MKAKLSGFLAAWVALAFLSPVSGGEPKIAESADWPQFKGPNGDSIAVNSPKLLDRWPAGSPKLLWKSDALPFAPLSGVGTPVVAGGKVFTFACVELAQDGVKPFTKEFLAEWGWVEGMPDDLCKKIDAATGEKGWNAKFIEAHKNKETLEAYTKEFLATLDAAQVQKFGDAIRIRFQSRQGYGYERLKWFASMRDKEIKTYGEFLDLFVKSEASGFFHSGRDIPVKKHANKIYKPNQKFGDSIICLDSATGKELWRKTLQPGVFKEWGTGFGCSGVPAIVKDKLYFAGSGGVYCLDIKNKGELVWQAKGTPSHTSVVIDGGVVYSCAGELAAFDAATGKELWRQPAVKHDSSSPVLWKNNGKTYVLCTGSQVFCVDATSGAVLWQGKTAGEQYGALAIAGDILVVRSTGGSCAYRLTPQKPEPLWTSKEGGDHGGSPIIYQDHVYMCGRAYKKDLLTVFDLKTGAMTLKQISESGETGSCGGCTTGIIADGKIIYVTEYDYKVARLTMFKAVPDKYVEVGRLPQREVVSCSSPAFAGGKVFVRMPTAIACYDLTETGK